LRKTRKIISGSLCPLSGRVHLSHKGVAVLQMCSPESAYQFACQRWFIIRIWPRSQRVSTSSIQYPNFTSMLTQQGVRAPPGLYGNPAEDDVHISGADTRGSEVLASSRSSMLGDYGNTAENNVHIPAAGTGVSRLPPVGELERCINFLLTMR
jgi:hypothetical protein